MRVTWLMGRARVDNSNLVAPVSTFVPGSAGLSFPEGLSPTEVIGGREGNPPLNSLEPPPKSGSVRDARYSPVRMRASS